MIVDSHCHLDFPELAVDEAGVVARAHAAGVGMMVTIATKRATWAPVVALAHRHTGVAAAIGVHPNEAGEDGLDAPDALIAAAIDPKVVAIGESGLDYYYDRAPREKQAISFRAHIAACRATGLPLVVHTRDADEDTMSILEDEMGKGAFRGVIHCYSSSRDLALRAVAIGFYLGLGGMLTFNRSEEIRRTVADMPIDRLLLETDSPFLAPVPMRGKTNEPALTVHVADRLALLLERTRTEVEAVTTANFFRLFDKAAALRPDLAVAA